MVIISLMVVQLSYAQNFPRVKSILENPKGEYSMVIGSNKESLGAIAENIQPKKNKRKLVDDQIILDMSFRVFQRAAVGSRPFGKIRYQIQLQESNGLITCTFMDFDFKKYERSARYGRMMEVKGKGQAIGSLEESLNEVQWGTVQWRMDQEVGKYQSRFLAFESLVDNSDTTQQDK